MSTFPIADIHCDLLSYLQEKPSGSANERGDVGCNLPDLKQGNVKLQVMAIYTATEKGSTDLAFQQSLLYKKLLKDFRDDVVKLEEANDFKHVQTGNKISAVIAIENAAGICEENEPHENAFINLERIISNAGKPLYIGFTHHTENRFGGGNASTVGLKNDGKELLNYLHDKNIAVDFSHTSDTLAYGILDHIDKNNLNIPVLASHSNFRKVFDHPRNLPDDIAKEIIRRGGLIGMNFLRAFMHTTEPDFLYRHIEHGLSLGGENAICFGADYFYTVSHPDQSRKPFFFPEHENASRFPQILDKMRTVMSDEQAEKIANRNVGNFIEKNF